MYLDGELPVETFKERMKLVADRYGRDLQLYGYNREDLGFDRVPPLNTDLGQAWLRREIEAIKPDLVLFDSIMCLLVGPMQDEATWAPMKPMVCELSARKIAQVWFNHANDLGKSFGDKTREWEMDTVFKLSKVGGDKSGSNLHRPGCARPKPPASSRRSFSAPATIGGSKSPKLGVPASKAAMSRWSATNLSKSMISWPTA
jgi:hypothetical protein